MLKNKAITMTPPCTGGWCRIRETCPNYTMGVARVDVRLCVKGQDGVLKDGTPKRPESKTWVIHRRQHEAQL